MKILNNKIGKHVMNICISRHGNSKVTDELFHRVWELAAHKLSPLVVTWQAERICKSLLNELNNLKVK